MTEPELSFTSKSLAFHVVRVGPLGVIVWRDPPISDDEFAEHLDVFANAATQLGPAAVVLNHSENFRPSPRQRAMVKDNAARMGTARLERLALIAGTTVVRGALTAITWILPEQWETRAFPPNELEEALQWLRLGRAFDIQLAETEVRRGLHLLRGPEPRRALRPR